MTKAKPSKSARKREHLALQDLGERLLALNSEQLATLELDPQLRDAVEDARTITSHGALRRQKQLIGKLMRKVDPQPIHDALERFGRQERQEKTLFRRAEAWRDRIASEGHSALEAFRAETGTADAALPVLVRDLHGSDNDADRKRIRRELFRAVHRNMSDGMQSGAD